MEWRRGAGSSTGSGAGSGCLGEESLEGDKSRGGGGGGGRSHGGLKQLPDNGVLGREAGRSRVSTGRLVGRVVLPAGHGRVEATREVLGLIGGGTDQRPVLVKAGSMLDHTPPGMGGTPRGRGVALLLLLLLRNRRVSVDLLWTLTLPRHTTTTVLVGPGDLLGGGGPGGNKVVGVAPRQEREIWCGVVPVHWWCLLFGTVSPMLLLLGTVSLGCHQPLLGGRGVCHLVMTVRVVAEALPPQVALPGRLQQLHHIHTIPTTTTTGGSWGARGDLASGGRGDRLPVLMGG